MLSLTNGLLLVLAASNLALARPGGSGDNHGSKGPYTTPVPPNYGGPTISYGGGVPTTPNGGGHETCNVYTINSYGYTKQPITSTKTYVTSVTAKTTAYVPYTTVSTIKTGGLVSQTVTQQIPTGSWVTSLETKVITASSWVSTNVGVATVVVSSVAPVVTQIVGSSATVQENCYPTTVFETVVGYTEIQTNYPVATTSCSGPGQYGWRK